MISSLFYNFTKLLFEVLLCYISNILTKALWNRVTLAIKKGKYFYLVFSAANCFNHWSSQQPHEKAIFLSQF